MRNQCYKLLWDEQGSTYVNYALLCASVALMIGGIYAVLNGNAVLHDGVSRTMNHLAVHFGEDMGGRGVPLRGGPAFLEINSNQSHLRSSSLVGIVHKDVHTDEIDRNLVTTLNASTHTFKLIDAVTGEHMLVRPTAGVSASIESDTKVVMLDESGYDKIVLDLIHQNVYVLNRTTNQRTDIDLATLQNMGLIEIVHQPLSSRERITQSVLSISSLVAPS